MMLGPCSLALTCDFVALLLAWLPLAGAVQLSALGARHIKNPGDLRRSYDYVVVGGGTAGLTVADRLTESTKRWFSCFRHRPVVPCILL